MRQVRGIAHHLVRVGLLHLADRERAEVPYVGGHAQIGGRPVRIAGLVGETLVLVARHVVPFAEQREMAARHQPQRPGLERVLLVADLLPAGCVLVESRVVRGHHHQAELGRKAILLVGDFHRVQQPLQAEVGQDEESRGLRVRFRTRRQVRLDRLRGGHARDGARQHRGDETMAQGLHVEDSQRPRRAVTGPACGGGVVAGRPITGAEGSSLCGPIFATAWSQRSPIP